MMKSSIILLALAVFAAARPEDTYTDKYDNVNVDEILANRKLLVPYVHCVLEMGKCSPEGKELKANIQDSLENKCSKCTEKQKKGTEQVIRHLIKHEAEFWSQLKAKYDPEGKYTTRYEEELRKVQE